MHCSFLKVIRIVLNDDLTLLGGGTKHSDLFWHVSIFSIWPAGASCLILGKCLVDRVQIIANIMDNWGVTCERKLILFILFSWNAVTETLAICRIYIYICYLTVPQCFHNKSHLTTHPCTARHKSVHDGFYYSWTVIAYSGSPFIFWIPHDFFECWSLKQSNSLLYES